MTESRLMRNSSLDILRAVCVLVVIAYHIPHDIALTINGTISPLLVFDGSGIVAVWILLVLAGFSSGTSIRAHGGIATISDIGAFYRRRLQSIVPAYYAIIGCSYIVFHLTSSVSLSLLIAMLSFQTPRLDFPPQLSHLWFVSLIAQYYVLAPWIMAALLGLKRLFPKLPLLLLLTMPLVSFCMRYYSMFSLQPTTPEHWVTFFHKSPIVNLDMFIAGLLLSLVPFTRAVRSIRALSATCIGLVFAWSVYLNAQFIQVYWNTYYIHATILPVLVLCAAALFIWAWSGYQTANSLGVHLFSWIGRHSYGVYLVHVPIRYLIETATPLTHSCWRGCSPGIYIAWVSVVSVASICVVAITQRIRQS